MPNRDYRNIGLVNTGMKKNMPRRFMQCDVFSDTAGAGNALGVVLDAENLSTEQMQAFAKFTNLSETTFVLPTTTAEASYRLRIFTPMSELPFAGHPSVGTAHALLDSGLITKNNDGKLIQECAAGLLPMLVEGKEDDRVIFVRAPRGKIISHEQDIQALLDAALANMVCGHLGAVIINNGPRWWCVELENEAAVRDLKPALTEIAALTLASDTIGLSVFARAENAADYQIVIRAFCPADHIPEDPVTGSANAAIAAFMHEHKALKKIGHRYTASQGREIGRNGFVQVRVDDDGEVWIGGKTQTVITGSLNW
jgi:PhzF family phenazine biosynthesis protein